jgi:hypothetical protein
LLRLKSGRSAVRRHPCPPHVTSRNSPESNRLGLFSCDSSRGRKRPSVCVVSSRAVRASTRTDGCASRGFKSPAGSCKWFSEPPSWHADRLPARCERLPDDRSVARPTISCEAQLPEIGVRELPLTRLFSPVTTRRHAFRARRTGHRIPRPHVRAEPPS